MSSKVLRNVALAIRLCALITSIAPLATFIIIFVEISNDSFPADSIGMTLLPVIALAISIIWNILAMVIMNLIRPVYLLIGDIPVALVLVSLGVIGFIHDNRDYLSNGMWHAYGRGDWITMDIGAYILMIVTLVLQILAGFLAILQGRRVMDKKENVVYVWTGRPPSYEHALDRGAENKEKGFGLEHQSFDPSNAS